MPKHVVHRAANSPTPAADPSSSRAAQEDELPITPDSEVISADQNFSSGSSKLRAANLRAIGRAAGNQAALRRMQPTRTTARPTIQRDPEKEREKIDAELMQRQKVELNQIALASPVKKFLASAEKDIIEEHLAQPKLTGNARDALKLAQKVAAARHDEDKRAVEQRIAALGVDLKAHPNAYDECAAYIRSKQLTINFGTHLLGILFSHKDYINMWNRSSTSSDPNYIAGRDLTERTLHGLPSMDQTVGTVKSTQKPQTSAQELLSDPKGLGAKDHKDADAAAKQAIKLQAVARDPTLDDLRKEFDAWEKDNPDASLAEYCAKLEKVYRGNWLNWYYETYASKQGSGMGVDRPISSGVNMSDYRGGSAPAYGTTHIVLKENVKERATVTGQDSKDFIYEKNLGPEAVGTFDELGPVMRYMEDNAFKRLVDIAVLKADPTKVKGEVGYIEAQIFGGIDLTRDIEKIVIDEDDLDLWKAGKLLIDPLMGEGVRPPKDTTQIKEMVIAFGKKHNIPVQFIRSGKDKNREGHVSIKNKAMDKLAVIQPWQRDVEQCLSFMKQQKWMDALTLKTKLGDPTVKSWRESSASKLGMGSLDAALKEAKQLYSLRQKLIASPNPLYAPAQIAEMADKVLTAYYQSPIKEENMATLQRISTEAIKVLAMTITAVIKKWD